MDVKYVNLLHRIIIIYRSYLRCSILPRRLSTCFGISSVRLQLFTTYLSSRTSTVWIPPHNSPSSPLTCEVPQGSVSGSVLFSLYTTPFRSLISASSISHLPYADETQLFVSFVPNNFSSAINTFSPLSLSSHLGYLLIIILSIPLKLNSFLSVSLSKPLK